VTDPSPAAYDRAVDRLLASDAAAEHFTRHWLDAVRYADTHGIHIDNYRSIWPYRDWVLDAFRRNLPFDQFTVEQMAGDLLPEATLDQKVASGFNRCLPTTSEGGAVRPARTTRCGCVPISARTEATDRLPPAVKRKTSSKIESRARPALCKRKAHFQTTGIIFQKR